MNFILVESLWCFHKKPNKRLHQLKHSKIKDVTRIVASLSHLNEETRTYIEKQTGKVELVRARAV